MNDDEDFDPMKAIGIQAARQMMRGKGSDPRPPTRECVRRWIHTGCPIRGQLLKLRAVRLNNEFLLMPAWVEAFEKERIRLATYNPLADEVPNRTREAEKRRAARELDAAGIGGPGKPRSPRKTP